MPDTLDYEWFYCPECDEEYLLTDNQEFCVICSCKLDVI